MTSALARSVSPGRYRSPLAAALTSPRAAASSLMRGSLDRQLAAVASPGRSSLRASTLAPRYTPPPATVLEEAPHDFTLGVMPELDSELLKRKHLIRYSSEELVALLQLDLLQRLQDKYASLLPLPDATDAGLAITELREHLQGVYDADLLYDPSLRALTMLHAVSYTTRTLDRLSEPGRYALEGNAAVLELGASTLAMFSSRAGAGLAFYEATTAPLLVKLLSPLYAPVVVVNVANTIGNLAEEVDIRLALRSGGGVGALVRLLRPDCEASVQAAAAGALSLLAARDVVVQDSVRYLGGVDLLVDLLVLGDAYTAEAARYCLLALRRGNTKNQAEVIASIRANGNVVRNVRRVDPELLRFEDSTPRVKSSYAPALTYTTPTKALTRPTTAD
ncbi:hypothetical protein TSOC_012741, partial [Tetrabaena socialis]